ncbi:hypothetical protein CA831_17100 [Burkholderia multivorans]|nr:hypothetical protein CA831_17100 [Burkholderia multivorans]
MQQVATVRSGGRRGIRMGSNVVFRHQRRAQLQMERHWPSAEKGDGGVVVRIGTPRGYGIAA